MEISFDKKKRIGVGVSGGADSMVLLDLLVKAGAKVTAVNVEHGIRGSESLSDSKFVKNYCEDRNIPYLSFCVDSIKVAGDEGISLELAARKLRYEVFDKLISEGQVDCIALAHHQDDQAETVLMRIFRGTGLRGLRGIIDREGFIHPLLPFSKEEIMDYAGEHAISFVEDSTNYDSYFTRNYIRKEILPSIITRYPGVKDSIERLSETACELEEYLMSEITPCTFNERDRSGVLPINVLTRHPAIAKKSIVECLRTMGVDKDIEKNHLESILALKDSENNSIINLPFGIDARKEYDKLTFIPREEKLEYRAHFNSKFSYSFAGYTYSFVVTDKIVNGLTFDPAAIPKEAVIRTRRDGDKFRRYGGKLKTLSDYFTDIRLPARIRDKVLVVAKGSRIYLILGIEISEEVKVTEFTNKIMIVDIQEWH